MTPTLFHEELLAIACPTYRQAAAAIGTHQRTLIQYSSQADGASPTGAAHLRHHPQDQSLTGGALVTSIPSTTRAFKVGQRVLTHPSIHLWPPSISRAGTVIEVHRWLVSVRLDATNRVVRYIPQHLTIMDAS